MDVTGLLVFLLLDRLASSLAASREFHLVNQLKNWTDAQSYCRDNFDEMLTIETADDQARVATMLAASGQTDAWIGLYDDVKNWRWSLDNSWLYDRDVGPWFNFVDDNNGGSQHCVLMYLHQMLDDPCSLLRPSICYDATSDSFIAVYTDMTWAEALANCRATYTDLAVIRNQADWDHIVTQVAGWGYAYWFGLSRESWKWSDQNPCSLRIWGPTEPHGFSETCGSAAVDGWKDLACNLELPFICSGPPRRVLRVMLKTAESVILNDPLVQAAIQKQMEDDARGQGVAKGFMLSWRKLPGGDVFSQMAEPRLTFTSYPCM